MSKPPSLPSSITGLLWDVDLSQLHPTQHASFIIDRVLEHGDFNAISDLKKIYPSSQIITTLQNSRTISAKVAKLFADYFGINYHQVRGLKHPFIHKQYRFH
jgi:hypothetical protein